MDPLLLFLTIIFLSDTIINVVDFDACTKCYVNCQAKISCTQCPMGNISSTGIPEGFGSECCKNARLTCYSFCEKTICGYSEVDTETPVWFISIVLIGVISSGFLVYAITNECYREHRRGYEAVPDNPV